MPAKHQRHGMFRQRRGGDLSDADRDGQRRLRRRRRLFSRVRQRVSIGQHDGDLHRHGQLHEPNGLHVPGPRHARHHAASDSMPNQPRGLDMQPDRRGGELQCAHCNGQLRRHTDSRLLAAIGHRLPAGEQCRDLHGHGRLHESQHLLIHGDGAPAAALRRPVPYAPRPGGAQRQHQRRTGDFRLRHERPGRSEDRSRREPGAALVNEPPGRGR